MIDLPPTFIDASTWMTNRGEAVTGDDFASVGALCAQVNTAIHRKMQGRNILSRLYENDLYDASCRVSTLYLRQKWVTELVSVKLNNYARGVLANFADAPELVGNGVRLVADRTDGSSFAGKIQYMLGAAWGGVQERPWGSLSGRLVDAPGAILVTYRAGFPVMPDDLQGAAAEAVSILFDNERRKAGRTLTSHGFNSESKAWDASTTANSVLNTPQIADVLRNYAPTFVLA